MNASEKGNRPPRPAMSSEAMVGIGITVASLGLLSLLLGWAQQMRAVPNSAAIWFALGAILAVVGLLAVAVGRVRKRGR